MIDINLKPIFAALFIAGVVLGLSTLLFPKIWGSGEIKSKTLLRPIRKELVITEGRVDTVYIYKIP